VQPPRSIAWKTLSEAVMLTDGASLVAAARSAAADSHGAKSTAFEGEESGPVWDLARDANATGSGRGGRRAGATQMLETDAAAPAA